MHACTIVLKNSKVGLFLLRGRAAFICNWVDMRIIIVASENRVDSDRPQAPSHPICPLPICTCCEGATII